MKTYDIISAAHRIQRGQDALAWLENSKDFTLHAEVSTHHCSSLPGYKEAMKFATEVMRSDPGFVGRVKDLIKLDMGIAENELRETVKAAPWRRAL